MSSSATSKSSSTRFPLRLDLALLLAAFACGHLFSQFAPLGHPLYAPVDRLIADGALPGLCGSTRPFREGAVREALLRMDTTVLSVRQRLDRREALGLLGADLADSGKAVVKVDIRISGYGGKADTVIGHSRGTLGAQFRYGRFSMVNRVGADITREKDRFDHLDRQFKKGTPADVAQAYLAVEGERFGCLLGRNGVKWGPGQSGGLLLSDHQPSMNQISAWAELGFLNGYTLSAKLAPMGEVNRYFSASRLLFRVRPTIDLALNQSVVYAGVHRGFEPHYVIPAFIYYFGQFGFSSSNYTENVFVGADGEWRFAKGWRGYFEFLADDFQVDRDSISRGVQNAISGLLGVVRSGDGKVPEVGLELYHANSYVYKHMGGLPTHYIANRHGGVLGHPYGPDAQALRFWLLSRFSERWAWGFDYALVRRGDLNDVKGGWDAYSKSSEAVPHGLVENEHRMALSARLLNLHGLYLSVEAGARMVENIRHQPDTEIHPLVLVRMDYVLKRSLAWALRPSLFPVRP